MRLSLGFFIAGITGVCHCARQQLISLVSGLVVWNDLIIISLQDKGGK